MLAKKRIKLSSLVRIMLLMMRIRKSITVVNSIVVLLINVSCRMGRKVIIVRKMIAETWSWWRSSWRPRRRRDDIQWRRRERRVWVVLSSRRWAAGNNRGASRGWRSDKRATVHRHRMLAYFLARFADALQGTVSVEASRAFAVRKLAWDLAPSQSASNTFADNSVLDVREPTTRFSKARWSARCRPCTWWHWWRGGCGQMGGLGALRKGKGTNVVVVVECSKCSGCHSVAGRWVKDVGDFFPRRPLGKHSQQQCLFLVRTYCSLGMKSDERWRCFSLISVQVDALFI